MERGGCWGKAFINTFLGKDKTRGQEEPRDTLIQLGFS